MCIVIFGSPTGIGKKKKSREVAISNTKEKKLKPSTIDIIFLWLEDRLK